MNVGDIAEAAHEINRAYCLSLGDASQPAWADAPEWQRSSAINGVVMHLKDPEIGPDASHAAWLKEKRDAGWSYGPVKDPTKLEHPCCVPFDQLPQEQKAKDFIFRAVVNALRKHAGRGL